MAAAVLFGSLVAGASGGLRDHLGAAAQTRQGGAPLVQETFTGATADAGFVAVGSACLTGAPAAAAPGPGNHPLGGCPGPRTGPVPPADGAPHGYLQLTDSSTDQSGAVLYDHALPATGGLDVTFDQWQYGSTTPAHPADGISFFLVDGAVSLTHPGAFGGSLGYAQKLPDDNPANPFLPGVDRGYLGVGLDVLGNYFGDWEQRGNGCARRSPAGTVFRVPGPGENMVTVRGPGDGIEGYCFLTATTSNFTTTGPWPSTLPGRLQGPLTALPPGATPEQAEAALEPSRRRVNVRLSPAPNPVLTVTVDFNDGTGPHQVINTPAPEPVPASYKFGFAASTGLFTDVHLIRNVAINSEEPLPTLDLVKQAREPLPGLLVPGTEVPYDFVVTNSGGVTVNGLTVNDPTVGPVQCPTTTLPPRSTVTCTATYVVTQADVDAGRIHNTAQASGTAVGRTVTSPPAEETVPIAEPPGLTVEKRVDEPGPFRVGDTVPYSYLVRNTGGHPLTGIRVHDDRVTGITCDPDTLAPRGEDGDTTVCHGTYTITQADQDAGSVTNHTFATGTVAGQTITSPPAQATVDVAGPPRVALDKRVEGSGPFDVGDRVSYVYRVTNEGSGPLRDLRVVDDHVAGVACESGQLPPGGSTMCHGSYVVTEADAQAGQITNRAQAAATDDRGNTVVSPPAEATVPVIGPSRIALDKRVESAGPFNVGDRIVYAYQVTNEGSRPLTDLRVADDRVTGIVCESTQLLPGQSTVCRGTYVITLADERAGQVTNRAQATAVDDRGNTVVSPPARVTIPVEPCPPIHKPKPWRGGSGGYPQCPEPGPGHPGPGPGHPGKPGPWPGPGKPGPGPGPRPPHPAPWSEPPASRDAETAP